MIRTQRPTWRHTLRSSRHCRGGTGPACIPPTCRVRCAWLLPTCSGLDAGLDAVIAVSRLAPRCRCMLPPRLRVVPVLLEPLCCPLTAITSNKHIRQLPTHPPTHLPTHLPAMQRWTFAATSCALPTWQAKSRLWSTWRRTAASQASAHSLFNQCMASWPGRVCKTRRAPAVSVGALVMQIAVHARQLGCNLICRLAVRFHWPCSCQLPQPAMPPLPLCCSCLHACSNIIVHDPTLPLPCRCQLPRLAPAV